MNTTVLYGLIALLSLSLSAVWAIGIHAAFEVFGARKGWIVASLMLLAYGYAAVDIFGRLP